jgi:Leucine-rich repeat (LRR) protein
MPYGLAHLQVLKLSGNKFQRLYNNSFLLLPRLLKLELNGCGIREIQPKAFSGLAQLTYLQLGEFYDQAPAGG